jgi:hypothetical protein
MVLIYSTICLMHVFGKYEISHTMLVIIESHMQKCTELSHRPLIVIITANLLL